MRINDIDIDKPHLKLRAKDICFPNCSINLIAGENGSGKTTVLEQIVFGENEIEFSTESQTQLYKCDRMNLFSYVPQDIPVYKSSVMEYISKGNADIDTQRIEKLMSHFSMNHIGLDERFDKLSGGEKMKLSIIAALLKDTPYVFMDEPTNHLDNDAVVFLIKIIEELSVEKTFIIVCHDSRVNFRSANLFQIEGGMLKMIKRSTERSNVFRNKGTDRIKKRYGIVRKKALCNSTNLISLYLILMLIVFLVTVNSSRYESGYSYDNGEYKPNIILGYAAEYVYSDTNKLYTKSEGIEIAPELHERMIMYKDIEKISLMDGVAKVIVHDFDRMYNRLCDIVYDSSNTNVATPALFSIPEDFINEFPNASTFYLVEFGELVEGRYPKDGEREICIPLQDPSHDKEIVGEQLGRKISLMGIDYTVVGVINNTKGLYLSSFEPSVNNGFYQFSEDTFDEFAKQCINLDENTEEILIYTDEGSEESVLNMLLTYYPATNYNSHHFTQTFEIEYNKEFVRREILPLNVILTLVISIIILLVRKRQVEMDYSMLRDFANYHIDWKGVKGAYWASLMSVYAGVLLATLLLNTLTSSLSSASNPILMLDILIIFVPNVLFVGWKFRHVN